jgi:hypothetical protein
VEAWPKVHFAKFILCIMLTHDDDKMMSFEVGLASLHNIFKFSLETVYARVDIKL